MARNDITGDIISTGQAKGDKEKYAKGWELLWGNRTPIRVEPISVIGKGIENYLGETAKLSKCASQRDGDCYHKLCPQLRDNEPQATGRSCPIYDWEGHDYD